MNKNKKIESINDLVMIHLTNYIPKNGIISTPKSAGAVLLEEYNGIKFKVKRERDSVHFTLNGEVESHPLGDWTQMKYAIIIPLENMEKEKIIAGNTVDLYTKGDVKIPDGSYIICQKEEEELLRQEVGENIIIKGVEESLTKDEEGSCFTVSGHANKLIEELGYKVENIGFWSWFDDNDQKVAEKIIIENGWELCHHTFSKERKDELAYEDINRTIEMIKFIKNESISNSSLMYILNQHRNYMAGLVTLVNNDEYLSVFCKKMKDIGIIISDDIISEVKSIQEGIKSDRVKEELENQNTSDKTCADKDKPNIDAEYILRRRVLGEIRLNQIRDSVKANDKIKFDELANMLDDTFYEFTTEKRRDEFLKSLGIEFSDKEIELLENQEIKNIYLDLNDIKYCNFSEEQRIKFWKFQEYYYNTFKGGRIQCTDESYFFGDSFELHGAIKKEDYAKFAQSEIESLTEQGKCVKNTLDCMLELSYILLNKDTTIAQFIENCDQMMEEANKMLAFETIKKDNDKNTLLDEAKESTKEETRLAEIEKQVNTIKSLQKSPKEKQYENDKINK